MAKIEVRKSLVHGNGIFANENISKGMVIEKSPMIEFKYNYDNEVLNNYFYAYRDDNENVNMKRTVMPMGFFMIYNHSYEPNIRIIGHSDSSENITVSSARNKIRSDKNIESPINIGVFIAVTIRDIKKDEEIFHNYYDLLKWK